MFFSNGSGSRVYDVDGNEYLDFTLSQGPLILGHSHPELLRRVNEELQRGQLYAGSLMKSSPGFDWVWAKPRNTLTWLPTWPSTVRAFPTMATSWGDSSLACCSEEYV